MVTHQSVGVQTASVDTRNKAISVLVTEEGPQTHSVRAMKVPQLSMSSAIETTSTEVGPRAPRRHSERELLVEVGSTCNIIIPSSVNNPVTVPTSHAKHDDVPLDVCVFQSYRCNYS